MIPQFKLEIASIDADLRDKLLTGSVNTVYASTKFTIDGNTGVKHFTTLISCYLPTDQEADIRIEHGAMEYANSLVAMYRYVIGVEPPVHVDPQTTPISLWSIVVDQELAPFYNIIQLENKAMSAFSNAIGELTVAEPLEMI